MIKISGKIYSAEELMAKYSPGSLQSKIISKMSSNGNLYSYDSLEHLNFELSMRINTIYASKDLNSSGIKFKPFREAFCNELYWSRTKQGGFLLKSNVKPSEGLNDIFKNGKKYGTECSTAIVILYYKAILDIYSEELFNLTFPELHLASWFYIDSDLKIKTFLSKTDVLPADGRYFDNPEYAPGKPEWHGENTIDLGDGTYYGHGIGIKNAAGIIAALNKQRKPNAKTSAYLTSYVSRPYYKHLADIYLSAAGSMGT